jgi:hypothetical protein
MLSSNRLVGMLSEAAKCCCIPNVYFKGYFPQYTRNVYNPQNNPCPYGDKNIQNMWDSLQSKEIAEIIKSENFYSKDECFQNVFDSLADLMEREKQCDVIISDYIRENYQKQQLFFTVNHPCNIVLLELLNRVFEYCGNRAYSFDLSNAWENDARNMFIYPSVAKNLELLWAKNKYCWGRHIKKQPSDIYGYVEDYISICKP